MSFRSRLTQTWRLLASIVPRQAIHWVYLFAHVIVFLVGVVLVQQQSTAWKDAGSALMAAGIAGWVLFLYVWLSESRSQRLEMLQQLGFRSAFPVRSVGIKDQYDKRLAHASSQIDIIGFGLRSLRQDYGHQFAAWAACASVRILLLDPDFPTTQCSMADQRDREERDDAGTIRRDVESFVKATASLIRDKTVAFDVRLYGCLPTVNIFRIDRELFWGPYLVREASRNLPTFVIADGGSLFPVLTRHFETIWSDAELSRPVPPEWLVTDDENSSR